MIYIRLFVVVLLIGCHAKKYKYLTLVQRQEHHLPIATNPPYFLPICDPKGNQLYFSKPPHQYGYIYDFKAGKLKDSIPLHEYTSKYKLFASHFVNSNEIMFFFNVNYYPNDNYDSAFCVYNLQTRTFKRLDTRSWTFYSQNGKQLPYFAQRYLWYRSELPYHQGRIGAVLASSKHNLGDTGYKALRQSLGGYFEIVNDTQMQFHEVPVYYPEWAYAHRYITNFSFINCVINNKGNPVYAFGMSPDYVEYDVASKQIKRHRVPSVLLDTVRPILANANGKRMNDQQEDPLEGEFYDFRYDQFRNQYWRILELRPDANASIAERNRRTYALQIFNDQFELLGEGLLPDELQPIKDAERFIRLFFTPEGPYIHNPRRSEAFEGLSMVFTRYEPQFSNQNPLKQLAKRKRIKGTQSDDWKAYLTQIHQLQSDSMAYIVIDPANCCPSCKDHMLDYFEKYVKQHPERPLKLVLTGSIKEPIQQALRQLKTQKPDQQRVFVDDKGDYKRFVLNYLNPKLVFFRKGEMVFNRQLNPADLADVELYLERFYKGEAIVPADGGK